MIQTSNKFDIFIRKNITQFILKLILLIVPNLLVLAIVYPGFIQADHQNTIAYITNGRFDEWHSLLWGFFAYPFLYLSGSIAVYGIVQIAIFAISIQYSLHTLQKIDILSNRSTWILTCIFALSPTFLMYNELYSSDVIFSILLTPSLRCSSTSGRQRARYYLRFLLRFLLLYSFISYSNYVRMPH